MSALQHRLNECITVNCVRISSNIQVKCQNRFAWQFEGSFVALFSNTVTNVSDGITLLYYCRRHVCTEPVT